MAALSFVNLFLLYSYIISPNAEMRENPSQDAEIVSSAYFSEPIQVLKEAGDWAKIQTEIDGYQGWVEKESFCTTKEEYQAQATVNQVAAHLYHVEVTVYGPLLTLPFESRLEVLDPKGESKSRWLKVRLPDGREGYIQRGSVSLNNKTLNRDEMLALSKQFIGLPYTWGGRSSFGYDCSGFVQMLYRQMGINLPRDSKDQMRYEGFDPVEMDQLTPGDLIFFGTAEEKIRHVVIYLGDRQFIHATVGENRPYLHVSCLDDLEWTGPASPTLKFRTGRTLKKKNQ